MLTRLNANLLQIISQHLDEKSKQQLASSCTLLWSNIARFKSSKVLHLIDRNITALQLSTVTIVAIDDKHYTNIFLRHVFLFAKYLQVVRVSERSEYREAFLTNLLSCFPEGSKVILELPYKAGIKMPNISYYSGSVDVHNYIPCVKTLITPETVRIKAEQIKDKLKLEHAKLYSYDIRDDIQYQLPCHINRLFSLNNYILLDNKIMSKSAMKKNHKITQIEATELANYHGKLFMENILIINNVYFIITSSSIFIHNHTTIDDCADMTKIGYQETSIAYVRRNKKFNYDYFELSIRVGDVEILATGGFWGLLNDTNNKLVPFLGSSIKLLPILISEDVITPYTRSIYVVNEEKQLEPVSTNRIINQYLKNTSTNKWGYHSSRFYNDDFFPTNPLHLACDSVYNQGASLLLRVYASKEVNQKEINGTIKRIERVERNQKAALSRTQKNIKTLLKFTQARFSSVIRLNNQELLVKRRELIDIYNSSLYNAIKVSNVKKEKKAVDKYKPIKINLFD